MKSPGPTPQSSAAARNEAVSRVLLRVLLLNLAVAAAKIVFGYATGAISILSDGFHSLTDGASNVVGLIGVRAAGQPPDADHPYGHRKYETVAAAAVTVFLLLVMVEVLRNAFTNLFGRSRPPDISLASFAVMVVTVAINLLVVAYESGEASRLGSEVLQADAMQTRGDVWSSLTVIAALVGARFGVPILDPLAALIVAGFIGHAGYQIASATTGILSDRIVCRTRTRARRDGVPACSDAITFGRAGQRTTCSWICMCGCPPACRSPTRTTSRTWSRTG